MPSSDKTPFTSKLQEDQQPEGMKSGISAELKAVISVLPICSLQKFLNY